MKLPLLISTLLAVCSAVTVAAQAGFTPTAELGNLMYVGDSITHGFGSASYRWPLFKIWTDNGIAHKAVGVQRGNSRGGIAQEVPYGGDVFRNVHSSMAGERAYEIAGRLNHSGRLGNSNIHDWLGLHDAYQGAFRINVVTEMPDSYILLIGTNDTLSDTWGYGIHRCLEEKMRNLLGTWDGQRWDGKGDMAAIISAMRQANPQARIAVCTIPTWMSGLLPTDEVLDLAAIARYNEQLKHWCREHNVALVDVNRGIIDRTRSQEMPYVGVKNMFVSDCLHPGSQGDLLIAGNIAQQLGYAGRTAGLPRKAASEFLQAHKKLNLSRRGKFSFSVADEASEMGQGVTVEFLGTYGNGAEKGWENDLPLNITLVSSGHRGTLSFSEGGLSWNGLVLYSADMSQLSEPVRLVFRPADDARHIPGGFYVWLGDKLIGEALPDTPGGRYACGVHIASAMPASISFSYDSAAWAPPSPRFTAKP